MQAAIPGADAVLVRYGDISKKSAQVRRMMETRLVENLRWALDDAAIDATVEREWARPMIVPTDATEVADAATIAGDTIGVVSASPVRRAPADRRQIVEAAREVARTVGPTGTFAVRARRADKSLPFTSVELERSVGGAVLEAVDTPSNLSVDLDDPDWTLHIEVRRSGAYLFTEVIDGPGGLPVGTQSPLVVLVSGGIDSPVAAYRALRRGTPIVPVYVDLGPYSGPDHQARALEAIATLRPAMGTAACETHLVPGGDFVTELVERVDRGRMLVLRRFMFRVADAIAEASGAVGIVTGESLGQKSSQTAANLQATSEGVTRPIHRPLLSFDKDEITELARSIGTFRSATIDAGCPSIVPDEVATQMTPAAVDELEWTNMDRLVEDAVDRAERLDPEALTPYRNGATAEVS